jgi:hypothetical protein
MRIRAKRSLSETRLRIATEVSRLHPWPEVENRCEIWKARGIQRLYRLKRRDYACECIKLIN